MKMPLLPTQFSELERFVAKWDVRGLNARYAIRLASKMEELQEFHDAVMPLLPKIKTYLDSKPLNDYSDEDRRLGRLMFAWVPAAAAVEVFKQPRVPDSKTFWDVRIEPDL
jgi:hypothetical protein